jgi:transcriptional regulator with XRE-family HTH domain
VKVEPIYGEVGGRIRAERERQGMVQADLAVLVGMSRTSVTNIECGNQRLGIHDVELFAEKLGVTPASLLPERWGALAAELASRGEQNKVVAHRAAVTERAALAKKLRALLAELEGQSP